MPISTCNSLLTMLFDAKMDAHQKWAKKLAEHEKQQPEVMAKLWTLLNHVYVVDAIFQAQLQGEKLPYDSPKAQPWQTVTEWDAHSQTLNAWYRDYVAVLPEELLHEAIEFTFADGDLGTMTRGEMLLHVIHHGANHRGAINQILADHGLSRPKETLAQYLHQAEPQRRTHFK